MNTSQDDNKTAEADNDSSATSSAGNTEQPAIENDRQHHQNAGDHTAEIKQTTAGTVDNASSTSDPDPHIEEGKDTGNMGIRSLYMVLFALIFSLVETIVYLTAIAALIFKLFTRSVPEPLVNFGRSLARYAEQIIRFLSFDTETRPFPFSSWPAN